MEYWDICDQNGHMTGEKIVKGGEFKDGQYHFAAEAWIVNEKGEFLVQQRSQSCEILPGAWALTTGRMIAGEDTRTGCRREMKEELGLDIQDSQLTHLVRFRRSDWTHLIWDIYLVRLYGGIHTFHLQEKEVAQVKFVSSLEMKKLIDNKEIYVYPEIYEVMDKIKAILR